ncbi:hypothetical protein [Paenibacillus borealis]|uniref:Uncharacterized protein n=1 Tax=Paenibacillus borealis TaxID=160799 RepID=A0A089LHR9_PAEBO|nr:hypothetical protein [Paenibacillus borealis]AIQ61076.1 hypothetical protein PBOR_32325 [Paenibacillus borealis]
MKTTGNLGLKKPDGTDIVDITDLNGNMDILDTAVKAVQDHAADAVKHITAAERTGWNAKASTAAATASAAGLMAAADKAKLDGVAAGANNYVHPNHTGDVTSTGDGVTAIAPGVIVNADVNATAAIDATKIGTGIVSNAEFGYLDGVTSGIQGQLNGKSPTVDYVRQPAYSVTAGTGAAYTVNLTPAPASLPEGFGITIVPNLVNTAGATLNVNGLGAIPLKDQKGIAYAAGKLLAGKPYMFRKVGTDFLADSAGGSGNAVAGDIRAGKTAATDAGDVTGTLAVQTGGTVTPGASAVVKPAGIYDTAITVAGVSVPAASVLTGTTIAGTAGMMPNRANDQVAARVNYERVGRVAVGFPTGGYLTNSGFGAGIASVAVEDSGLNPAYVRSDVSILGMQGSMPVISTGADVALSVGKWGDGALAVYPREGYRKGGAGAGEIKVSVDQLKSVNAHLQPWYIAQGAEIFGVYGTVAPALSGRIDISFSSGWVAGDGRAYLICSMPAGTKRFTWSGSSTVYYDYGRFSLFVQDGWTGAEVGWINMERGGNLYLYPTGMMYDAAKRTLTIWSASTYNGGNMISTAPSTYNLPANFNTDAPLNLYFRADWAYSYSPTMSLSGSITYSN